MLKRQAVKKRLYRKIRKRLFKLFKKLLGCKVKGHKRRRLNSLAAYITGMIRTQDSALRSLGKGLLQLVNAYSREKAAKKFVYNKWVDYETFYEPYIKQFVEQICDVLETDEIVLIIDGSAMGKDHACLMISLAYGKRSIPLRWFIKRGNKGHFTTKNHVDLAQAIQEQFSSLFARFKQVILLGDGEFDSPELQAFCKAKKWNYVFRTACNTVMYEGNDRFQAKHLAVEDGVEYLFIADIEFTEQRLRNVHFLLWHHPKYEEPIPLVSDVEDALFIMKQYKLRFAIECLFKDLKSTSFNIHKTRLKDAYAIRNLVMIAAFAFTLLVKIAIKYDKPKFRKMVHRVRKDQVVASFFFFALEILDHFLEYHVAFSFKFSKNSS